MALIEVDNICKEFQIYKRQKGFFASLKTIFARDFVVKKAVENITFEIDRGELVGYIGPNGAGKSTTIKMLSGILLPSSGTIKVDGRVPHANRKEHAMHIGVVFGQRSQLYWDLPMEETFDLYKRMFKIEETRFKRNVDFFVELLEMQEFLHHPVRQLSLGQKMRAELAVAFLHDPDIVFLDEPTIGLDVVAKSRIRRFIREVNEVKKTTVILTTHDMDDIEQICNRIIMIDKGNLLYDGSLASFKQEFSSGHMLIVDFVDEQIHLSDSRLRLVKEEGKRKWFVFQKETIKVAEAISLITGQYDVDDLTVRDPDIEQTVREIYEAKGKNIPLMN